MSFQFSPQRIDVNRPLLKRATPMRHLPNATLQIDGLAWKKSKEYL
jgi:hypothetical protein